MGDQIVEEVSATDGVDVVVGRSTQLVLDLAPDVVALLLDRARRRARVVEVEVDLDISGDAELGEQVVDHLAAVGVQDLALDGADPEMLERGVHLGRHLGHALVDHRLHALEHALEPKARTFCTSSARMVSSSAMWGTTSERASRLLVVFWIAGAPRAVVSTRLRLPSRSSIMTEVVETPCSRNRPS